MKKEEDIGLRREIPVCSRQGGETGDREGGIGQGAGTWGRPRGRKGWWGRKVVLSMADRLKKWKINVSGDLYRNTLVECCGCSIWVE